MTGSTTLSMPPTWCLAPVRPAHGCCYLCRQANSPADGFALSLLVPPLAALIRVLALVRIGCVRWRSRLLGRLSAIDDICIVNRVRKSTARGLCDFYKLTFLYTQSAKRIVLFNEGYTIM